MCSTPTIKQRFELCQRWARVLLAIVWDNCSVCLLAQLFVLLENWKWDLKRNIKRRERKKKRTEKKAKTVSANHSPEGGGLRLPLLAFYLNIKGELDPQRHIVKPVTPITKAVKWVEEAAERWEGDEGPGATAGDANRAGAGDCGAVAGKVTVRRAIIILCGHEPANRTGGRESYWHSGELKDVGERRGASRRERLESHEGLW